MLAVAAAALVLTSPAFHSGDGPCPPSGSTHHYVFRLFAVDRQLPSGRGASTAQFAAALRGHVLATARLVGLYRR